MRPLSALVTEVTASFLLAEFDNMKLKELDARFLWQFNNEEGSFREDCPSLILAQGIIFLCPKCFTNNQGGIGTHSVICWFEGCGIPDDFGPGPGRWTPQGTGIDDLTFVPSPSASAVSVRLTSGCQWHGFIANGEAN